MGTAEGEQMGAVWPLTDVRNLLFGGAGKAEVLGGDERLLGPSTP